MEKQMSPVYKIIVYITVESSTLNKIWPENMFITGRLNPIFKSYNQSLFAALERASTKSPKVHSVLLFWCLQ